ncbi:Rid family hydrolase [uncultured Sunxiuqinia sp.]|uniref:Rid family hydrolase n=1 Tax=uncultured Sunxiuqinia sp. TaxID=1573825 RepID=UPI00261BEAB9|nr:Rid family hydrolase [uncultured Sunxiuqinia sp.]
MLKFSSIHSAIPEFEQAVCAIFKQLHTINNLVKISFFTEPYSNCHPDHPKAIIAQYAQESLADVPTGISVIEQPPLGCFLSVEYATYEGDGTICHKHDNGLDYIIIEEKDKRLLLLNGISNSHDLTLEEQAKTAFESVSLILKKNGFPLNSIVRQWNYIPGIIAFDKGIQNYQAFNDVRSRKYNTTSWPSGYPAATGIGVDGQQLIIDILAVDGYTTQTISNHKQVDAHDYSADVLIGQSNGKTSPKFERAKAVVSGTSGMLFISGTAAIKGEGSDLTDIRQQTLLTLKHIEMLCSSLDNDSPGIQQLRVYIKREEDFDQVQKICHEHYPDAAIIYVQADVCRDELLVEIEAFATLHV